jgi:hypothetical protein
LSPNDHFPFVPKTGNLSRSFLSEQGPDLFLSPPAPEIGVIFTMDRGHSVRAKTAANTNSLELLQLGHATATLACKWLALRKLAPRKMQGQSREEESSIKGATGIYLSRPCQQVLADRLPQENRPRSQIADTSPLADTSWGPEAHGERNEIRNCGRLLCYLRG